MQTVLLIVALSMDVFLASVACGAEQIRIEKKTALCIGAVCSGVLLFSLVCGKLIDGVVREKYAAYLCFAGLFLVGAYKLTEYGIRAYIRRHHFLCKQVKMKFSQLNFIISIYNNPAAADRDCSATMSVTEGICFALAMSVDGFFRRSGGGVSGYFDCRHGMPESGIQCTCGAWRKRCREICGGPVQKRLLLDRRRPVCGAGIQQNFVDL